MPTISGSRKIENVLITGGSGFIGSWLPEFAPPNLLLQILNRDTYAAGVWKTGSWKYIIHLAPVPVDDVIQCAKACGAAVLFASSGGVYDRVLSDYFRMKLDDENKLLASGLDVKIARIFATCGRHMKWERYAIGNFIKQAVEDGPIVVNSYGKVVRSYMYGSDLATWLWAILNRGQVGQIYEVGSEVPHTTQELAYEIASHFDPRPKINLIQKMGYEPRPFYVPDTSMARDELGLSITVDFVEAVRRTVEDYRNVAR